MVVGTAIYRLLGMLLKNGNYVYRGYTLIEPCRKVVDIFLLIRRIIGIVRGQIILARKRRYHRVDLYTFVKLSAQVVERINISYAVAAAEKFHRSVMPVLIDHENAVLRLPFGIYLSVVLLIGLAAFLGRRAFLDLAILSSGGLA